MKLYNHEIEGFGKFLLSLELKGKESRMRTRLVKLLNDKVKEVFQEKDEIMKQYAKTDSTGEIAYEKDDDGNTIVPILDVNAYNNEILDLFNEECIIEENEERKTILESVRDSVLDCDLMFSGNEALEYDRYCEIVESINYQESH